ncbi:hypothetical protein MJO29_016908 [Puccinia striiformis f. sp. tritici]|uniref:Uncharacterized protein n=1 Tax=Puccinia striiformis f. sp. tritici PST-78 TaxID=1165861 RepID=A0A0L0V8S5_9BASI|nr:hypothetical protein MJO29_016908 [Puccinia striiformis f. sp. tritici]KAI9621283.1 hypothetical protein H4Q26_015781 [Puccinia striiformis f. sp. tritici PST-130]KNE95692.1 hypothetical protein PSTG_11056 [Puccinia striiformis f. sp. tritici PST-78]
MKKEFKRSKGKERLVSGHGSDNDDSEDGKITAQNLRKLDEQADHRLGRRKALANRRKITTKVFDHLKKYTTLFHDERLCSSDKSMSDLNDDRRIKHVPVWRSKDATALVEHIDSCTEKLRNDEENPSRSGRKPAKRISLGARARWEE